MTPNIDQEVYDFLRKRANIVLRNEKPGFSLRATDLVNESCLRAMKASKLPCGSLLEWIDPMRAAQSLRQVVIDYVRRKTAKKRGGKNARRTALLDIPSRSSFIESVDIHDAFDRLRAEKGQRSFEVAFDHAVLEMTHADIAEERGVSVRYIEKIWRSARDFLQRDLR